LNAMRDRLLCEGLQPQTLLDIEMPEYSCRMELVE